MSRTAQTLSVVCTSAFAGGCLVISILMVGAELASWRGWQWLRTALAVLAVAFGGAWAGSKPGARRRRSSGTHRVSRGWFPRRRPCGRRGTAAASLAGVGFRARSLPA